jgi:hypothetical protein
MLWIIASLFFLWCAFREVHAAIVPPPGYDFPRPIYKPYLATVLVLAGAFAWIPVRRWHFEYFLSVRATVLADGHRAKVHCNTMFDTMVDQEMFAAAHANPTTGKIAFQHPWCSVLESYLSHPGRASSDEIRSLDMFTHESMHIRGELNEAKTECEAVQRNYRAGKLLGVPDDIAKGDAEEYYNTIYKERATLGLMQAEYYSDQCAPGKALDEHLSDSTWAP